VAGVEPFDPNHQIPLRDVNAQGDHAFEPLTLEQKVERVKSVYRDLLLQGKRALCAFSGGKDSSVMANLMIETLLEMKNAGELDRLSGDGPRLVVTHSDTRLENPVVNQFALSECRKMQAFFEAHDLPARVDIIQPGMSNNYLVGLIGGRLVATLPGMSSNCSLMMKVRPITSHKQAIFKAFGKDEVFTAVATRRDESSARSGNMEERGDSELAPVLNAQGQYIWSPVADFTLDDVFMHIAEVRNGIGQTYSDFTELIEHYRDLNSGECMVNVYAAGNPSSSGCGGRSGCHVCLKLSRDHSLENMIKEDRFAWMKPLSDFRNYIGYHHWNPDKRRWLARSVNTDGTIDLNPSSYSASHTEDLLRFALTIQRREYEAAYDGGFEPRFTLLREADLIAIELLWSRYGFHEPAKALSIWDEVMNRGLNYVVPELNPEESPYTRADIRIRGDKILPFADDEFHRAFNGFRDLDAATAGVERTVVKKNGKVFAQAEVGGAFDVDEEAAELFLGIELHRTLEMAKTSSATAVYHKLIRMGVVTLKSGSESEQDRILAISNQIARVGLAGLETNPDALRSVLCRYHRAERSTATESDDHAAVVLAEGGETAASYDPTGQPLPAEPGFNAGECISLPSGALSSQIPEQDYRNERRAHATVKRMHAWLVDNAVSEAYERGDVEQAQRFAQDYDARSLSSDEVTTLWAYTLDEGAPALMTEPDPWRLMTHQDAEDSGHDLEYVDGGVEDLLAPQFRQHSLTLNVCPRILRVNFAQRNDSLVKRALTTRR
jgi:3'-phosphoadenosine 5'-phosphosulfate sulfotransferase (PAPS reductase)/FAD synthetase